MRILLSALTALVPLLAGCDRPAASDYRVEAQAPGAAGGTQSQSSPPPPPTGRPRRSFQDRPTFR